MGMFGFNEAAAERGNKRSTHAPVGEYLVEVPFVDYQPIQNPNSRRKGDWYFKFGYTVLEGPFMGTYAMTLFRDQYGNYERDLIAIYGAMLAVEFGIPSPLPASLFCLNPEAKTAAKPYCTEELVARRWCTRRPLQLLRTQDKPLKGGDVWPVHKWAPPPPGWHPSVAPGGGGVTNGYLLHGEVPATGQALGGQPRPQQDYGQGRQHQPQQGNPQATYQQHPGGQYQQQQAAPPQHQARYGQAAQHQQQYGGTPHQLPPGGQYQQQATPPQQSYSNPVQGSGWQWQPPQTYNGRGNGR